MSITFEVAVQELQTMFPEWDQETLETLLQANGNHVERTIETILGMEGATDVITQTEPAPSQTSYQQRPPSFGYDQDGGLNGQPPSSNQNDKHIHRSRSGDKKKSKRGQYRGIRITLPDDFLRVPGYKSSEDITLGDEQLAILLQNELFAREVEQALGPNWQQQYGEQQSSGGRPQSPSQSGSPSSTNVTRPQGNFEEGDLTFFAKKLSSLTSTAKQSLSNLAVSFQKRRQAGGTFTRMTDNAAPAGQSETSRLVGNDREADEDEVISFEGVNPAHRGRHILDDNNNGNRSPSSNL